MFKGLWFFLKNGWKYDKWYVIENALLQLVNSLTPLVGVIFPKYIIDEMMGAGRADRIILFVALMAGLILVSRSLSAFLQQDGFTHRVRVDALFGMELHRMQARADYWRLEDPGFLDLKKRAEKFLTCDWHGFGYLLDCAMNIVGQLITIAGIAAVLFALNGWFVLLMLGVSLVGAVAGKWAKGQAMKLWEEVSANQRGWSYYSGLFSQAQYGKEIRLNGIAEWLLGRERDYLEKSCALLKRQNGYYIRSGQVDAACTFVQQLAAYGWLCVQVISGGMGIGNFTMGINAVTTFAAATRQMLESLMDIREYDAYFEALDTYLHLPATLHEGKRVPVPEGPHEIQFCDVGFRYPGQAGWALRHVDLTLKCGEKLSVVGENGAGKSTFIKLMLRLYDPTEGMILLDGQDIREMDVDEYAKLFGTVFQDFQMFSFSLGDNVTFGKGTGEEVLRKAGFGAKLDTLPRGADTHVSREFDEQGFDPSGGEAQKIALARALHRKADIVILDEPTSALDPRAEYELYSRLRELVRGKSAVFVSHRLSSARFCDHIAVFRQGRIAEYGNHAQLYEQGGLYRELYDMQTRYYTGDLV